MSEMSPELRGRVLPRILADYGFKPSADKKWLNQGKCPACGKKELFTSAENPWVLRCGRANKCGQEFSVRDLYPEEFRDFTKRFEATPQNPTATADAYMREARGLSVMRMKGYYTPKRNGGVVKRMAARRPCGFTCQTAHLTWSALSTR